ncbi:MAG TPA: outer membrane beta-barrel protein [Methylomirabilota bacterium]|nr:outer membrane beta-barrel protein [Methylomirabilota bacterium]
MNHKHHKTKQSLSDPLRSALSLSACLGAAVLAGTSIVPASAQSPDGARVERLEKENQDLKKRLDALEATAKKEGILPSGAAGPTVKALGDITLNGFVSTSYFYDTSNPADNSPNAYLWNRTHNSFTVNKVKLTLASKPVEASGDKWDAGYRASLIFGSDAPIVNTGGELQGWEDLREAVVELNAPIGTGLNIKAGQLISLLNFESGDGGVVNPNFSQGNQWFYTGNGPSAGVQLGYAVSEMVDVKVRVQNGMFTGPVDGNGFKTFMGSIGIKPDDKTGISLIGFGGREGAASDQWLKGGSLIATRKLTDMLNFATELDYFNADTPGGTSDWWSAGGWLWMDFTEKVGLALRGDYIADSDGAGTSGLLGLAPNTGQDLMSLTLTLNWKPIASLKIQPEIRYDHTTLAGAFDGDDDRVTVGAGVSYSF